MSRKISNRLNKHLKRKIHKNRWLVWSMVVSVLIGAALVSYIEITNINFEQEVVPYANADAWQSYRDRQHGFMLRFPPTWVIEAETSGVTFSDTLGSDDVVIMVSDAASEAAVRKNLNIVDEKRVRIDSKPGFKIINELVPDAYETVLLVKTNNKLYKISGSGENFERIASTLKFLGR